MESPGAASISVLGLGLMGRPLARALGARGWNRSGLAAAETHGIELCDTLASAAAADVVLLMLYDSAAVGEVLAGLEPHLGPGQLVVDMGTSRPADSVARAARLAARGVGWVDAPVSGGPAGVEQRSLAIMAGGTPGDVDRARPTLARVGRVTHVGGPGAGHMVKLVNQTIVPLYVEAVAEGLALAERCGLDLQLVRTALAGGSADSRVFQVQGARMARHDYTPGARASVMLKDLRMISELAASVGIELPHVSSTLALYEQLERRGEGALDVSALHRLRLQEGPST